MDLMLGLMVLVFVIASVESGGHGGHHHHTHLRIHLPELIHHDHHKKMIIIHHHHKKPKPEQHHHHHHHHHPKPVVIPHSHHYNSMHHATKKLRTITTSHHGHPAHHSDNSYHNFQNSYPRSNHPIHHSGNSHHHSQDTYAGYGSHYGPQNDASAYGHESPSSFENDFNAYSPAAPPSPKVVIPTVHGVQHTVKQVKVFGPVPVAIPNSVESPGYQVTEDAEEDEGDTFTSVDSQQDTVPDTFGYLHEADTADFSNSGISSNHHPFKASPQLSSVSADGIESYTGIVDPNQIALTGASNALDQPHFLENSGSYDYGNSFSGHDAGTNNLADEYNQEETPIAFQSLAGVQKSVHTTGVQTVEY